MAELSINEAGFQPIRIRHALLIALLVELTLIFLIFVMIQKTGRPIPSKPPAVVMLSFPKPDKKLSETLTKPKATPKPNVVHRPLLKKRVMHKFVEKMPSKSVPVSVPHVVQVPIAPHIKPVMMPVETPPNPPKAKTYIGPAIPAGFEDLVREAVQGATRFPYAAQMAHLTGQTQVAFKFQDGHVSNVHIQTSSGMRILDKAAMQAVYLAVYPLPPARLVGKSVSFEIWVRFYQSEIE